MKSDPSALARYRKMRKRKKQKSRSGQDIGLNDAVIDNKRHKAVCCE